MAIRRVTATIKDIEGDPIAGVSVSFILRRSTFVLEDNEHYPPGQLTVVTDVDGKIRLDENNLGIDLWTNADAAVPVKYECVLPNNDRFFFYLSSGVSPVDLAALRAAGLVPVDESTEATLQQLLDAAMAPLYEEFDAARTAWSDGILKDSVSSRLAADFAYLGAAGAVVASGVAAFEPPARNATLLINTTANAVEVRLLETTQMTGRRYLVKLVAGANEVTFDALVDVVLASLDESVTVEFDGAEWIVIEQFP